MITDKFAVLLEDLSKHLSMNLSPDANNSCMIVIQNKLEIQLSLDSSQKYLIIGSVIAELPSGRFRQDCLFAALKANARPYPLLGIFSYSRKINSLVLYEKVNLEVFNVGNILSILTPFIKKAMTWKESIQSGLSEPSHEEDYKNLSNSTNFFGG